MFRQTKEEHDLYMDQMISNVANDEKTFNIDNCTAFADDHHAYAILLEELDESIDALEMLKANVETLWKLIKCDFKESEIKKQLERISLDCKLTVGEVIQVYAVALKAIEQLHTKKVFK